MTEPSKPAVVGISAIQKGIPLLPKSPGRRGGLITKEFIAQLKVGDSFEVTGRKQTNVAAQMCCLAKSIGEGRKFTTRKTENGVRVWRIA